MPQIRVILNGGDNVENVQAVRIGDFIWGNGNNAVPYGTLRDLPVGIQQITVLTANNHNQVGHVEVMNNHNMALSLTVNNNNLIVNAVPIN